MSRPSKFGLDYFPLDVTMDEEIELIEAEHGLIGFGVIIKLYQQIYKHGYYMEVSKERLLLFKRKVNVDINSVDAVIKDAINWGLFDENLYYKYNVLTSRGVQKRFVEATNRRKEVEFIKEYLLLEDVESMYPEKVNVNIKSINADINSSIDDKKTQRKGKERKQKQNIEKKQSPIGDLSPESVPGTLPPSKQPPSVKNQDPIEEKQSKRVSCPQKKIKEIYHEELPELPRMRVWGDTSQANLRRRWREDPERQSPEWWRRFFREYIRSSDFLMGHIKEFQADLDWIVRPAKFQNIMNGIYLNREQSKRLTYNQDKVPMDFKTKHNLAAVEGFINGD